MPFAPVILATDLLLWLLVAAVFVYVWYCRRRPHLAAPWKRVFQSRAAMVTSVVLICYAVIGLADTLHFRLKLSGGKAYSPEVLSVLDLALAGLRERREKTYSAPLATRLYAKEQIELPDGKIARDFPRLLHGGAHLKDESTRFSDIAIKSVTGLGIAAVLAALVFLLAGKIQRRRPDVPWGAAAATVGVMLLVAVPVALLARGYHVLGTDKVGQDVLYLALKSIRVSLVIGTLTTLVLLPLGIALGVMAG